MEINEFVEKVAEQFDDSNPPVLEPTTVFKDLEEWSSLVALSLIAMVDEEYEVELSGDDIRNARTVQDLFDVVSKKL